MGFQLLRNIFEQILNVGNYKAIIIDDEEAAIVSIKLIIEDFCQDVDVAGSAQSASQGIQLIMDKQPDIVFLDIEMPKMNGFEMLEILPERNFELIFITAYNQYALEAFKVNAIDYLLKPISIPELLNAVNRVRARRSVPNYAVPDYSNLFNSLAVISHKKVAINSMDGVEYIDPEEIIYLEAEGAYTHIITTETKFTTPKNLKDFMDIPALTGFFRIHNSYIVNLLHIKKYNRKEAFVVMSNTHHVTVSRRNKDDFLKAMDDLTK